MVCVGDADRGALVCAPAARAGAEAGGNKCLAAAERIGSFVLVGILVEVGMCYGGGLVGVRGVVFWNLLCLCRLGMGWACFFVG